MTTKQESLVKESLVAVHKSLTEKLEKNKAALPKSLNRNRFVQNCMAVLSKLDNIEKYCKENILQTLLKGAFLGLDFFNNECYAIPFNGQLNFISDYKGDRKLVLKYSVNRIKNIYALLVRKGDDFEHKVIDNQQFINFNPIPFNDDEIIGVFAIANFENGGSKTEVMSKNEVLKIKGDYSTAKYSKAWDKSPGEMIKKTALRRLCKQIDLDFDSIEQQNAWHESSGFEFEKSFKRIPEKTWSNNRIIESNLTI